MNTNKNKHFGCGAFDKFFLSSNFGGCGGIVTAIANNVSGIIFAVYVRAIL